MLEPAGNNEIHNVSVTFAKWNSSRAEHLRIIWVKEMYAHYLGKYIKKSGDRNHLGSCNGKGKGKGKATSL
jgi:hypothetical protein